MKQVKRKKIEKDKLTNFNNKLVRIVDTNDLVYEGIGYYNNSLYNFHEHGREEESIQILNFNFYKSTIKSIKKIKEYTSSYTDLELELIKDLALLEDVLFDEEEDLDLRVLSCLENNTALLNKDLCKLLKKKCKTTNNKMIKEKLKKVIKQK